METLNPPPARRRFLRATASMLPVAFACLFFSGCSAPPPPGPQPEPVFVPELRAQALFFGDRLEATVTLAAELPGKGPQKSPGGGPGGLGGLGVGGGGNISGGNGGVGGSIGGSVGLGSGGGPGQGPGGGGPSGGGPGSGSASSIREGNQPALRLTLDLDNRSTQPQTVDVPDFTSQLGNFAVRPERIVLQPGQTSSADPMFSRRYSGGDIVVTLTVRFEGQTETQELTLRPISDR